MTIKPPHARAAHGTYIRDDRRWRFVREISVDAAAQLLGIPEAERQRTSCPDQHAQPDLHRYAGAAHDSCALCGGHGYLFEHLYLAKGYVVVIGPPADSRQAVALHNDESNDPRYVLYVFEATP